MKKIINRIIISLLFLLVVISCDNYERTSVESAIYTNYQSLEMFVGDNTQLIANPQDASVYSWQSENEQVATVSNGLVNAISEGTTNIIVKHGDIYTRVPVMVVVKIPTTRIELSMNKVVIAPGKTIIVSATSTPSNANDIAKTDFYWWSENESVATVNSVGEIKAIGIGTTKVFYRKGTIQKDVTVDVSISFPFKGPHIISKTSVLILPLRDFDIGGEGNAYHDINNEGRSPYRQENGDPDSPGVEINSDGFIDVIYPNEWLLYTVEVEDPGTYGIQISTAGVADGKLYLEIDGVKTENLIMPTSGSWNIWKFGPEPQKEISLTKGKHTIKVYFSEPVYNANEMRVEFLK